MMRYAPLSSDHKQLVLVLGGARSGKSTFAEQLAATRGPRITYLATAPACDAEMTARIAKHRADRPAAWRTVECPLNPAAAIHAHADDTDCFVLDCLTLLVSNLLLADETSGEAHVQRALDDVLAAFREAKADLILVSNEVGLGLVPAYPLGRQYRDVLGRVNQQLAAVADATYFLIAGLPLELNALACSPLAAPTIRQT